MAWAGLVSVPLAMLMAQHLTPLPAPEAGAWPASGRWHVVHILAGDCPCSADVAAGLAGRHPQAGLQEEIWLIGNAPWGQELARAGFAVQPVSVEELQHRRGPEGAPWLLVIDPAGRIAYSGGHTGRPAGHHAPLRDVEICGAVQLGRTIEALPAYGCAVSAELRTRLDPLQLKYPAASRP